MDKIESQVTLEGDGGISMGDTSLKSKIVEDSARTKGYDQIREDSNKINADIVTKAIESKEGSLKFLGGPDQSYYVGKEESTNDTSVGTSANTTTEAPSSVCSGDTPDASCPGFQG